MLLWITTRELDATVDGGHTSSSLERLTRLTSSIQLPFRSMVPVKSPVSTTGGGAVGIVIETALDLSAPRVHAANATNEVQTNINALDFRTIIRSPTPGRHVVIRKQIAGRPIGTVLVVNALVKSCARE